MTRYSPDELDGWEFKIVRSNFGRFKNPEFLRNTCIEQAKNGWEMLEKFDDTRVRFKRQRAKHADTPSSQSESYRSSTDASQGRIVAFIAGAIALIVGLVLLVVGLLR